MVLSHNYVMQKTDFAEKPFWEIPDELLKLSSAEFSFFLSFFKSYLLLLELAREESP